MFMSLKESILLYSDPYSSFLEHFKDDKSYSLIDDAKYINTFLLDVNKGTFDHERLYNDLMDEFNIGMKTDFIKEDDYRSVFNQYSQVKDVYDDEFMDDEDNIINTKSGKVEPEKQGKLKFIINFIKKVISLKAEDLEATNKLRYKALRMALGLLVIGGSLLLPGGLLMNLVKAMVAGAVAAYSAARLSKLQDMLETQVERLEARMEEEDDPRIKAELSFAIKGINKELKKVDKRRTQLSNMKKVRRKNKSDNQDW